MNAGLVTVGLDCKSSSDMNFGPSSREPGPMVLNRTK